MFCPLSHIPVGFARSRFLIHQPSNFALRPIEPTLLFLGALTARRAHFPPRPDRPTAIPTSVLTSTDHCTPEFHKPVGYQV